MRFEKHSSGWIARRPGLTVFFGNRHSALAELKAHFPQYRFLRTKQVHGKHIVEQNLQPTDYEVDADGSWTRTAGFALCSISADCVPLLITAPGFAMALHAGWRGVAQRIFVDGLKRAIEATGDPSKIEIWIGPHIRRESFVVRDDARDLLQASTALASTQIIETIGEDQYRIDLEKILRAQAGECGIKDLQIQTLEVDTYRSEELHSHRRDRENAGRQISFIVLESIP
ncbi:MAG: polyphenol oxidase family protein [Bdellovibrionaceae bacterium]|nr:polyphenol oxidase family protein [Pseudobdellovibrionaceae bacterium]